MGKADNGREGLGGVKPKPPVLLWYTSLCLSLIMHQLGVHCRVNWFLPWAGGVHKVGAKLLFIINTVFNTCTAITR